jgi:hypothetical protein
VRVAARVSQPFEDNMNLARQAQFLHAAAEAIALVSTQRLVTLGRNVHLLGDRRRRGEKAPRSGPDLSLQRRSTAGGNRRTHGDKRVRPADALLKSGQETPEGARDLRALLPLGSSNPNRIAGVDRFLAAEGIAIPE